MINEFKKIILAGIGSAAYTYEKASKFVDEMVDKGKLTIDEGKELSEELKRTVKVKKEDVQPITKDEMISLFKEMNFASKEDLASINERLSALEQKTSSNE